MVTNQPHRTKNPTTTSITTPTTTTSTTTSNHIWTSNGRPEEACNLNQAPSVWKPQVPQVKHVQPILSGAVTLMTPRRQQVGHLNFFLEGSAPCKLLLVPQCLSRVEVFLVWIYKTFEIWLRDTLEENIWKSNYLVGRESSSAAEEENKGQSRVIEKGEKDKLVSENIGRLEETEGRKETSKKRTRVSTSSLPPVWHLVPVTCLYLLLLLLLHLLSPLLTNLPTFPSTSPPSTCDVYNQSIARHSSL